MKQFITAILFSLPLFIYGQDKDVEAQVHYLQAEDLYSKSSFTSYDSALKELSTAETILGSTNPKILYLKIKTLSYLYPEHYPYIYGMDTCLKKFFTIVDAKNYPTDKYAEMIFVKNKFTTFINVLKDIGDRFIKKDYSKYNLVQLIKEEIQLYPKIDLVSFESENDFKTFSFSSPRIKYNGRYYFGLLINGNVSNQFLYFIIKELSDNAAQSDWKFDIATEEFSFQFSGDCFKTWKASSFKRLGPNFNAFAFRTKFSAQNCSEAFFLFDTSLESLNLTIGVHGETNAIKLFDYFSDKRLKKISCVAMDNCN